MLANGLDGLSVRLDPANLKWEKSSKAVASRHCCYWKLWLSARLPQRHFSFFFTLYWQNDSRNLFLLLACAVFLGPPNIEISVLFPPTAAWVHRAGTRERARSKGYKGAISTKLLHGLLTRVGRAGGGERETSPILCRCCFKMLMLLLSLLYTSLILSKASS